MREEQERTYGGRAGKERGECVKYELASAGSHQAAIDRYLELHIGAGIVPLLLFACSWSRSCYVLVFTYRGHEQGVMSKKPTCARRMTHKLKL